MQLINFLSVTMQHFSLLLAFLEYKRLNKLADRNGKFGDLPKDCLSGDVTSPHPTLEWAFVQLAIPLYFLMGMTIGDD